MLTTLQALAHAPMTLVELAILTGRTVDQTADDLWDNLALAGQADFDLDANAWSITEAGRETLRLVEAFESGRRRDAACVGRAV